MSGWDLKIMPIRTSNNSGGTASQADILDGSRWAVDNGAVGISASFTGVQSSAVQTTGEYIRNNGGIFLYRGKQLCRGSFRI